MLSGKIWCMCCQCKHDAENMTGVDYRTHKVLFRVQCPKYFV
uniref:Uncharacterized protein n=1 Tax=Salmonella sp. 14 TaxID=1179812 RepID=I3W333_9ENTR|nr:hypothetical protein [Salmonella sp. 14]